MHEIIQPEIRDEPHTWICSGTHPKYRNLDDLPLTAGRMVRRNTASSCLLSRHFCPCQGLQCAWNSRYFVHIQ